MPETFSFIDNAKGTIDLLDVLAACFRDRRVKRLYIDHRLCKSLDLCASAVMDVLIVQGKRNARSNKRRIVFAGKTSGIADVDLLLKSNGLLHTLDVPLAKTITLEQRQNLKIFSLRRGRRSPPGKSTEAEITASDLMVFFNQCLAMEGFALSLEKQQTLLELITEVLGNAEDHSDTSDEANPVWYVIGYYKRSTVKEEGGECHIAIFNFGKSIFQTLKSPETSNDLKAAIGRLADSHRRRGFLGVVIDSVTILFPAAPGWSEEALWTLYALQEGVSRFNNTPGNEDRGNGTINMIKFFTDLAPNNPKMVLVSGRTWIKFDGTYSLTSIIREGGSRQIISFNTQNDLDYPPDSRYVKTLAGEFPGTLVSLRFSLRPEDLAKITERFEDHENS